ncbi:MAG TPA: hypothetical protein VKG44_11210 [Candidatus Baltobacteraceae bacterium]|nr:hypothetical protein [Candidatus Baltobacteraceae bacterium]
MLWFALALWLAQAIPSPMPHPSVLTIPPGGAAIENSGSSNAPGYRIVVEPGGRARYALGAQSGTKALERETVRGFFADLEALWPFGTPGRPCLRSVSFGSVTTVTYNGRRTPPLDCPGDSSLAKISADVASIVSELGLQPLRARRLPLAVPAETPGP